VRTRDFSDGEWLDVQLEKLQVGFRGAFFFVTLFWASKRKLI